MRFCRKCIQPDTRPGIVFDTDGVCMACRWEEERHTIDWEERERQLHDIAVCAKKDAGGNFECIVGVSGGKDSLFQALYAKERLGLKVLLVNCTPDAITDSGRANLENLLDFGFDMISFRPDPVVLRKATSDAFFRFGNPVKPSEYPLYAVSWITASKFNIPLIIQGENPAHTLGLQERLTTDDNALSIKNHDTLDGGAATWVTYDITLQDLLFYDFPSPEELEGVRSIYLSYYAKEWGFWNNTLFSMMRGLNGRVPIVSDKLGKINPFWSVDADMHSVNQLLKYYKFGFGSVTDEVCYAIRELGMSREEAIDLVNRYDGKCSRELILEFCDYIGIGERIFWRETDRWVNKALFYKGFGIWRPRFVVGEDFNVA